MKKRQDSRVRFVVYVALVAMVAVTSCWLADDLIPTEGAAVNDESGLEGLEHLQFGLHGQISSSMVVGKLAEDCNDLVFVGTSSGLYAVSVGGELQHHLYTPFGVRRIMLLDDVNNDSIREILLLLEDPVVPVLRCYDGASWEELWHFSPREKVFVDRTGWADMQYRCEEVQIIRINGAAGVVTATDRHLFCIDSSDGGQLWKFGTDVGLRAFAVTGDANGDDSDEVLVGSDDGLLRLLDGETEKALWQVRLETRTASYSDGTAYTFQPLFSGVSALGRETGKIAVASTDGVVRLLNLSARSYEWEISIIEGSAGLRNLYVWPSPSTCSDSPYGILVTVSDGGWSGSYDATVQADVTLFTSVGERVWTREMYVRPEDGVEVAYTDGKPLIIESVPQEVRLLDLATAEIEEVMATGSSQGLPSTVKQYDEDLYLVVSSRSDLKLMSSSGDVKWHYPRIGNIMVLEHDLTDDGVADWVFCCLSQSDQEESVRLLKVLDGASQATRWSHEVDNANEESGLSGVQIIPDLIGGDGIRDLMAYRADEVFLFSGTDGTQVIFSVGEEILSAKIMSLGGGKKGIALVTANRFLIADENGALLWDRGSDEGESVQVIDDINGDGVDDLALFSAHSACVMQSRNGTLGFQTGFEIEAESGRTIEFLSFTRDIDNDGIGELAYLLRQVTPAPESADDFCPILFLVSPEDGQILLRIKQQGHQLMYELAYADFDGDSYADSMALRLSHDSCEARTGSAHIPTDWGQLQILSGRHGSVLWESRIGPEDELGHRFPAESSVTLMKRRISQNHYVLNTSDNRSVVKAMLRNPAVDEIWLDADGIIRLTAKDMVNLQSAVMDEIRQSGVVLKYFGEEPVSLETIYKRTIQQRESP